jgi:hypothetical protein
MTVAECIKQIAATEPSNKIASKLNKTYGEDMPKVVVQMVTVFEKGGFVDDYRFLSLSEIVHAEADLHVPFKKLQIIPLVDGGDNDFIAYNFAEDVWMRYNVVEEIGFGKKKKLNEILK